LHSCFEGLRVLSYRLGEDRIFRPRCVRFEPRFAFRSFFLLLAECLPPHRQTLAPLPFFLTDGGLPFFPTAFPVLLPKQNVYEVENIVFFFPPVLSALLAFWPGLSGAFSLPQGVSPSPFLFPARDFVFTPIFFFRCTVSPSVCDKCFFFLLLRQSSPPQPLSQLVWPQPSFGPFFLPGPPFF